MGLLNHHPVSAYTLFTVVVSCGNKALWARASKHTLARRRIGHRTLKISKARISCFAKILAVFIHTSMRGRTILIHSALWLRRIVGWRKEGQKRLLLTSQNHLCCDVCLTLFTEGKAVSLQRRPAPAVLPVIAGIALCTRSTDRPSAERDAFLTGIITFL